VRKVTEKVFLGNAKCFCGKEHPVWGRKGERFFVPAGQYAVQVYCPENERYYRATFDFKTKKYVVVDLEI
jgi:hypothetical protein